MDKKENIKKELKRVTIKVPEHIQEFYKEQGEKYTIPYSNYMTLVLTQYYENERNKQLVDEFNQTIKLLNSTAGNVTAEEMMAQMREMMTKLNELEK